VSWPTVALGEIFEIARGGSPRPIDDYITDAPDGVNWISIKDASNSSKYITKTAKKILPSGVSRSREVKPGDFLLTNSMSFGRPYILRTSGCIHDGWLVLSGDDKVVDQDYFYHLLGSDPTYRKFKSLAAGAVVKNLNIDLVKTVKVPLPPLAEQRRIAAILDKADALRAKRREAIAKLDQLLQSVFLEMFGDPVTNPKGWPMVPFGQVTNSRLGKMLDKRTSQGEHMKPYLANLNVQWGRFELDSLRLMNFSPEDQREFSLRDGDLLMCEGGQPGRCAIWRGQVADCYYQKALHRVRCHEDACVPEYLQWLFWFLSRADAFSSSIAVATIAHLPGIKLKKMLIPLPALEKQILFANFVRANESNVALQNSSFSFLEGFFGSLQKKAFEGIL